MTPGLYIVGTPIGNLGDITLRALETLKQARWIMAEDTRETHKLLAHFQIATPMQSCHKFNEAARVNWIAEQIRGGAAVALVTDGGMPAVSDPGARTVNSVRAAGLPVFIVPGPSAVTSAVALSGFGGAGFVFEGFLPRKSGARRKRLARWAACEWPVVLFESPYRLLKLLDEIRETLGERELFVGRELTKKFEEGLRGTPTQIAAAFAGRTVKGELTVVIAPAPEAERKNIPV